MASGRPCLRLPGPAVEPSEAAVLGRHGAIPVHQKERPRALRLAAGQFAGRYDPVVSGAARDALGRHRPAASRACLETHESRLKAARNTAASRANTWVRRLVLVVSGMRLDLNQLALGLEDLDADIGRIKESRPVIVGATTEARPHRKSLPESSAMRGCLDRHCARRLPGLRRPVMKPTTNRASTSPNSSRPTPSTNA